MGRIGVPIYIRKTCKKHQGLQSEWTWVALKALPEMLTQRLDDLFLWRIIDFRWRVVLLFSTLGLQKNKTVSVKKLNGLPREVKNSYFK